MRGNAKSFNWCWGKNQRGGKGGQGRKTKRGRGFLTFPIGRRQSLKSGALEPLAKKGGCIFT